MSAMLVYVHGFRSSSQSYKAALIKAYLTRENVPVRFCCPDLPVAPEDALSILTDLVENYNVAGLIGSSLGGYYSIYLSHQHGLKSALINPVVRPMELLQDYYGSNQNPYIAECCEVMLDHSDVLQQLYVPQVPRDLVKAWLQTDDEVLDYRRVVDYLGPEQCVATSGGGHAFVNYESIIRDQLVFLGVI